MFLENPVLLATDLQLMRDASKRRLLHADRGEGGPHVLVGPGHHEARLADLAQLGRHEVRHHALEWGIKYWYQSKGYASKWIFRRGKITTDQKVIGLRSGHNSPLSLTLSSKPMSKGGQKCKFKVEVWAENMGSDINKEWNLSMV